LVVLTGLVLVILLPAAVVIKRTERSRARIDRHGLDDLRRIYRQDNPRGPGLDLLIRDHQRPRVEGEPIKRQPAGDSDTG
jgi:hypothetical protein